MIKHLWDYIGGQTVTFEKPRGRLRAAALAKHIVITAAGTGMSMWDQTPPQPAALIPLLDPDRCFWQPLGNYPASVVGPQMGRSVAEGVDEMVRLANEVYRNSSLILLGYSQGAIVVSHFVRDEVLSPRGRCYGRAPDIAAVATWGNPCRMPGFASGNQFAGWPMPHTIDGFVTGGIAGKDDLKPADIAAPNKTRRHYWGEFVNTVTGAGGDLYTECPVGADPWSAEAGPGEYETQIYDIVQNWWPAILRISHDVFELVGPTAFRELLEVTEAIINGGMFAAAGANAAHYTYPIQPIADFVNLAAQETAPH